ncbi:MAG: RNA polymerase sigma factor [Flavobacteriales bacterium]
MTDAEIIDCLRSGNRTKGFQRLYRYFPKVKNMVKQYGGSSADAEDVFQEALIILSRKCANPDFTLTASLDTYLYSVCRFTWCDELRKRKRIPPSELSINLSDAENDWTENEHNFKLAEKALAGLGEKCREILQLFYIAKMNMADIAAKYGYSSEQSARNQKYKCLETSRSIYRQLLTEQL